MANFCTKCGSALEPATGLCPKCDSRKLDDASDNANLCVYCGGKISPTTGMCTNPLCNYHGTEVYTQQTSTPVEVPAVEEQAAETKSTKAKKEKKQKPVKEKKQKPVKEKEETTKKRRNKVVVTILSILLSLCLFVTLLSAVVIYDIRNSVKEKSLLKMLDGVEIDLDEILDEFGMDDNVKLENFYTYLYNNFGADVSNRKLSKLIDKSNLKEYVAGIAGDFFEDFFDGTGAIEISRDDARKLIRKNSSVIESTCDIYLNDSLIDEVVNKIFGANEELMLVSTEAIREEAPALYTAASIGLSYGVLAVLLLLSALIIFAMFMNSLTQGAGFVGVVSMIIGAPFALGWAVSTLVPNLWSIACGNAIVGALIGNFMKVNGVVGLVLVGLGIALLILRAILKNNLSND